MLADVPGFLVLAVWSIVLGIAANFLSRPLLERYDKWRRQRRVKARELDEKQKEAFERIVQVLLKDQYFVLRAIALMENYNRYMIAWFTMSGIFLVGGLLIVAIIIANIMINAVQDSRAFMSYSLETLVVLMIGSSVYFALNGYRLNHKVIWQEEVLKEYTIRMLQEGDSENNESTDPYPE